MPSSSSPEQSRANRMSHRSPEEAIEQWLQIVGWKFNPFANPKMAAEPLTQAEEETGEPVYWHSGRSPVRPRSGTPMDDSHIDDDDSDSFDLLLHNHHALVWGQMGAGKSATRLLLKHIAKDRGNVVAEYLGSLLAKSQPDQYVKRMTGLIMRAALPHLGNSGLSAKDLLVWRSDLITSLSEVVKNIVEATKLPVFMLVDDLLGDHEDIPDQGSISELIHRRIEPFLRPEILNIPELYLKMFLPQEAQDLVEALPNVRWRSNRGRVESFGLIWTKRALFDLLHTRLSRVTNATSLDEISTDQAGLPFALEEKLIDRVYKKPGEPRALLRIAHYMITARTMSSDFPTQYRLTEHDLYEACRRVGATYQAQPNAVFG